MYKAHRIIAFALVFLCIMLTPMLMNLGTSTTPPSPSLDTPRINSMTHPQCIEPAEYMRVEHMNVLDDWRTAVVRLGSTEYTNSAGQVFLMSMEDSCLGCHSNRAAFCDTCYTYVAVSPDCWSCHNDGEGAVGK